MLNQISSDECGQSGGEVDSDEDIITDYQPLMDMLPCTPNMGNDIASGMSNIWVADPGSMGTVINSGIGNPLPTISVTSHSPASKTYLVLEDSIQQVRELNDIVQRMRDVALHQAHSHNNSFVLRNKSSSIAANTLNPLLYQVTRLSASCPILNESFPELDTLSGSLGSSPVHQPPSRKGSDEHDCLYQPDVQRRLSWTGIEDLHHPKDKLKYNRQRSISFSSIESEADESFIIDNAENNNPVRLLGTEPIAVCRRGTRSIGGASTHSLNEADLQSDFKKINDRRGAEQLRLLTYKLPLQKSISTPSIIAVKELATEPVHAAVQPVIPVVPFDHHSEKRRKRGSLFFRKKKNSSKNSGSTKRGSGSFSVRNSVPLISQVFNDDKDSVRNHHDPVNFSDEVSLVPAEFLSDSQLTAADLCADYSLGLHDSEPDSWTPYVGKEVSKKLKDKEVKRQEHIYEFILTEKHHCMTLLVMQKIFMDGLQKYFQLGPSLERMFPKLQDLISLHLAFLSRLRQRQREAPIVTTISDILLDEFSNQRAAKLKAAYGDFCSRHRDAVEIYKFYMQSDRRFGEFVRHCQQNPLLKKKGIPECILFVTQRLTKYPLLIEPLIKTSKDNKNEQENLQKSLKLIKEILVEVDAKVAEKEKEDRKLEIYNKIDAKSCTIHRGHKFKKSDILQGNRSLKFEGVAMLMQGRGKMQIVLVIVLTDVLFFLQESSNKYNFFTPDSKAGVVSLQKLLVREKAGQDSRGIYLISSNPSDPEMFELKVHKPKDKQVWMQSIRLAVQFCPDEENEAVVPTAENKCPSHNAKQGQIRHLVGLLRQKDVEQALLLEEKMALQLRLLAAAGSEPPSPPTYRHLVSEQADTGQMWKEVLTAVHEVSLLASSLFTTGTNLSRSASSVGEHQSETYVLPTLPKRAETFGGYDNYSAGLLKAGGRKLQSSSGTPTGSSDFDDLRPGDSRLYERLPFRNYTVTRPPIANDNLISGSEESSKEAALLSLGREQQYAAVQLSHYVYTLLCIISQLITSNESLQIQITNSRGSSDSRHYNHNQQLEELRNLQNKFSTEKAQWSNLKEQETNELEEKKKELLRLQEQIRVEQDDVKQQRAQLYSKMQLLTQQGLLISASVALPVAPVPSATGFNIAASGTVSQAATTAACPSDDSSMHSSTDESSPPSDSPPVASANAGNGGGTAERRKDGKWKGSTKSHLPMNLMSATNKQKASQVPLKQQIPFKLALKLNSGVLSGSNLQSSQQMLPMKLSQEEKTRRSSTGYQRLGNDSFSPPSGETTPTSIAHGHSRTGSSPAMMQGSPSMYYQQKTQSFASSDVQVRDTTSAEVANNHSDFAS